ncbi:MAG TPA: PDZ domain-containing protein, partial [Nitrosomonas sp.]|nr:PDZ domain-containing protein [Nitrosomonas sp.]
RIQKQGKVPDKANRLGLALSELTDKLKKQLGVEGGLLVEEVQPGTASRVGIRAGDIILGLNSQDIKTVKQFNQMLDKISKGKNIALLIKRGDMTTFITMKLDN